MYWYSRVLSKYADFSGRARRMEYWSFWLINAIISGCLHFITNILHLHWLAYVYNIAVFIPSLAVGVRRLHDTGRSGWWLLLVCIPIIGWLVLFVFLILDSQAGDNEYGANPKTMT